VFLHRFPALLLLLPTSFKQTAGALVESRGCANDALAAALSRMAEPCA
jgi:hypothetical protein